MTKYASLVLMLVFAGCGAPKVASIVPLTPQPATAATVDRRPIASFAALPAAGELLPDFSYEPLVGRARVTRASLRGAPALVVFWSTHCPFGKQLIAQIAELRTRIEARGARIVILAGDVRRDLQTFEDSARTGLSFAVVGDAALQARFDRSANAPERTKWRVEWVLPTYLLLDSKGHVAFRNGGPDLSSMQTTLDSLLTAQGR